MDQMTDVNTDDGSEQPKGLPVKEKSTKDLLVKQSHVRNPNVGNDFISQEHYWSEGIARKVDWTRTITLAWLFLGHLGNQTA